jgi:uncharacterized protein (TIGR03086 family)
MAMDLKPAACRMTDLIGGVSESQLAAPTPCPDYTVGDLLDHIGACAVAFTAAAQKDRAALEGRPAPGNASNLGAGWQTRIPDDLGGMADAWSSLDAWTGMTRIGGSDTPGEIAGGIGLEELVVHGWDLARASGQTFSCDETTLAAVHGVLLQFQTPGKDVDPGSPFGKVVEIAPDAPLLDQVIALSGRDPSWSPG